MGRMLNELWKINLLFTKEGDGGVRNDMKFFNTQDTRGKRKYLRKNQTNAEALLWAKLRNKQLKGTKFFRQYGISSYIADFYCPKIKLAIEIDGGQHFSDKGKMYDLTREQIFGSIGIKTVRFSNVEVLNQLDAVLEKLWNLTPPSPLF